MNMFRRLLRKNLRKIMRYNISGLDNCIIVNNAEFSGIIPGLDINISGNNNKIIIQDPDNFSAVNVCIRANNCTIKFGRKYETLKSLNNISIVIRNGDGQHLEIGDRTLIWGANIFMDEEKSGLIIGKDCLFSDLITIWTADGHPVFDMATNRHINSVSNPVCVGDNVWIGQGVRFTKNGQIPDGCVVGGGSVVCKKFTIPHCAIAGNPARIIKENVNWKHY